MSLVLYDAPRCPYCARARIVLAEKGIAHETVEVDLRDRPDWIYEKNPTGRVPVLEVDGRPLPESTAIMEYLEERYPEPALLPPDAADRAVVRARIVRADEFTTPYYRLRRGDEDARERVDAALGALDASLAAEPWLGGAAYSLADVAYVPWLLRARDNLDVDLDGFPALSDWLARLEERPAIAAEARIVVAL